MHTIQSAKSRSQGKSDLSHEEGTRALQLEVDQLKRKLRHAQQKQTPSSFDASSDDREDASYRRRSRTPLSEPFSYDEECHHKYRRKSPRRKGLGNDAMSRALNQIFKSPFMCKIEAATLPQRFHQPTFTIYNGQIDPVEHVSHFNQGMAVHAKNETLMCKVFLSSLGPVAIRYFDSLRAGFINSFKELTQAFGACFITCNRVPRPLAPLLSLSMREGETLKTYSTDIGRCSTR